MLPLIRSHRSSIMDLSIIGSGYVGLVTGACFADVGHNVICVDNDAQKIKQLQAGEVPIYEPGLEEIIHRNVSARRLRFTGSIRRGSKQLHKSSSSLFLHPSSRMAMSISVFWRKLREKSPECLTDYRVIVDKSTVPVKTGEKVAESIKDTTATARTSMWSAILNFCVKAVQ